ncbi:hypothetical protein ABEB36_005562 [Hypothenemus hampei]|uniref:Spaetzle domain-containing protein n=1 Tax=Hypothenemus hampei TaxID=57062 RepID=A0ABD1EYM8_HYPHA
MPEIIVHSEQENYISLVSSSHSGFNVEILDQFFANLTNLKDPDYPEDEIRDYLLSKNFPRSASLTPPIIATRLSFDDEEDEEPEMINLCKLKPTNPLDVTQLLDRNYQRRTIINPKELWQDFTMELCESPDQSGEECNNIKSGYLSMCVQIYRSVKLTYFDSQSKSDGTNLFPVPACCACKLQKILK